MSEEKAILISEPEFTQIKNGKKTVEVRGNYGFFSKIEKGVSLKITNRTDHITCHVKEVYHVQDFEELFKKVKFEDINPEAKSSNEVEEQIKKFVKPADIAKGFVVLVLEHGKSGGKARTRSKSKSKTRTRSRSKSKKRK